MHFDVELSAEYVSSNSFIMSIDAPKCIVNKRSYTYFRNFFVHGAQLYYPG